MKIAVLGAGVIGVSTAYTLARQGHDITLIDKNDHAAGEASQANGAQLSYSYVDPFAGLSTLKALPKYMMGKDPAVRMGLSLSADYLAWGLKFLGNCLPSLERKNLEKRAKLAKLSADMFRLYSQELPSKALAASGHGKLVLLSSRQDYEKALAGREKYEALGLERNILNKAESLDKAPALHSFTDEFHGAIYAQSDYALDTQIYCKALLKAFEKRGGRLLLGANVKKICTVGKIFKAIETQTERLEFDAAILCTGNQAAELTRPHGISLPILCMQGYSLTAASTPQSSKVSLTSLKHKIVFANLGKSMRIAGFMDANQPQSLTQARCDELLKRSRALWPTAADYDGHISTWSHYRPMTPSGVPIIGPSKIENLYLNVGHGSLGYTFAAGSAMKLAEQMEYKHKNQMPIRGGTHYAVT